MMAAARLARCGFDLDDEPPHVEYPWQGPPYIVSADRDADADAVAAAALANAGLLTGALMLALAAPGLFVLLSRAARGAAVEQRCRDPSHAWHRHAVAAATVSCGYFGPSVAAASAALLYRGSFAIGGVLAGLAWGVAGAWCRGAAALLAEHAPAPSSPSAQLQESVTAEVRPEYLAASPELTVTDGVAAGSSAAGDSRLSMRAARYYSIIDVSVALVVGAIAGVQPPSGTSQDTCRVLASCAVAVALLYAAAMLGLRPLRDRLESSLHLGAAVLQVAASLAGLLAAWPEGGDEAWQERLDVLALASFALFFSGSVALAVRALCFGGGKQGAVQEAVDSPEADAVAPLLVVPAPANQVTSAAEAAAAVGAQSGDNQSRTSGAAAPVPINPLQRK
jgi:hypothetical protein